MDLLDKIANIISEQHGGDVIIDKIENSTPPSLVVNADMIHKVCETLFVNPNTFFDSLSCVIALDNGPEANSMEVIYNLYSIALDHSIMLKVQLQRDEPQIDSVCDIWRTADWHEREAYDLMGIKFNNHPDLRRILMPGDWMGHPLQKDYIEPEKYRGMRTIRDEDIEEVQ